MTGFAGSIEKQTLDNSFFRKVLFTGRDFIDKSYKCDRIILSIILFESDFLDYYFWQMHGSRIN